MRLCFYLFLMQFALSVAGKQKFETGEPARLYTTVLQSVENISSALHHNILAQIRGRCAYFEIVLAGVARTFISDPDEAIPFYCFFDVLLCSAGSNYK